VSGGELTSTILSDQYLRNQRQHHGGNPSWPSQGLTLRGVSLFRLSWMRAPGSMSESLLSEQRLFKPQVVAGPRLQNRLHILMVSLCHSEPERQMPTNCSEDPHSSQMSCGGGRSRKSSFTGKPNVHFLRQRTSIHSFISDTTIIREIREQVLQKCAQRSQCFDWYV
jgi:hypothetical protein